jgi:hypothetical protein
MVDDSLLLYLEQKALAIRKMLLAKKTITAVLSNGDQRTDKPSPPPTQQLALADLPHPE